MGEIVDLVKKRKQKFAYWRCDCGCRTFFIRNDDTIECTECLDDAGYWVPVEERPK